MPPHRDWTRHGVGRALLWWPFMAFVLVAAFPAVAVPCVIGSGVALVFVGLVGGALGRRRRARRLRDAGRAVGTGTRTITAVPARGRNTARTAVEHTPAAPATDRTETADAGDAEDDHRTDLQRRAA